MASGRSEVNDVALHLSVDLDLNGLAFHGSGFMVNGVKLAAHGE